MLWLLVVEALEPPVPWLEDEGMLLEVTLPPLLEPDCTTPVEPEQAARANASNQPNNLRICGSFW